MPRELRLSDETRGLLAGVWHRKGRPALFVEPSAIAEVRDALKCTIPDEVLAIVVAEGRTVAALPALTLELTTYFDSVHGKGRWRSELEFDHVLFARMPSDDSEPLYASFRRGTSSLELVLWDARHPQAGGVFTTLANYVAQPAPEADVTKAFKPVIDVPPPPPARRVVHPTFGEGTVLEQRDDKLRIDFGAAGIKMIAERFVKPV